MMFNEYMEHSNQCAGYYSVTRKEEVNIQQTDTNRFRQKWLESSGGINYPTPPQNSTPPLAQSQFNNINSNSNTTGANRPIKKEHHPQQHQVHGYMGQVSNNGPYPNNGPNQYKQNGGAFNPEQQQHMIKQQHIQQQQHGQMQYQQQQQHQQSKYYEPQFIPNMKDNSKQQNPPQQQQHTRQSPSPMILSNNPNINNSNNPGNFANQQTPTNKFGMHQNNTTNSINSNPNTVNSNNNKINGHANNPNIKMEPHNYANNSNGQQQKMFHHNPSMMHQGNTYPSQGLSGHPNMHQNNNFKQPFQQPAQHQQMYHQQAYNVQVQKPHQPQLPPPQQQQQQQQHQQHQYSLDLKAAPRVNSPQIHSPYPQIHSNSGITETNSPKETWSDANKRDLVSPSLASSNSFSKKISSSSLVQQQHSELPIKSPAPPGSIEPKTLNDIQVSASPVRMMTQSPSNSSLNTSICVPTPLNIQQNLIDFNQDQLIADDCDSSNLLSPLNNIQKASSVNNNSDQIMSASTNHHGCQNTKSSILSEINIDELFLYYPKVFEEFFFSFKLNSIEQIEHDLRTYCEQQFKLNFTNKSSSTGSNSTQQFSIRI